MNGTIAISRVSSNDGDDWIEIRVNGSHKIAVQLSLEDYAKATTGMVSPCQVKVKD